MKIIILGDFKEGRELMKQYRAEHIMRISELKKTEQNTSKGDKMRELESAIKFLNESIPIFSVSRTIPAEHKGIVFNGKILQAFVKKLKGFHYQITTDETGLNLEYGRKHGEWTGELQLLNLSDYFKDFTDIPRMVIDYDFLG